MRGLELMRKAGLTGFSLHALRHSHASVLLSSECPVTSGKRRFGHADSSITLQVYSPPTL